GCPPSKPFHPNCLRMPDRTQRSDQRRRARRMASVRLTKSAEVTTGVPRQGDIESRSVSSETMRTDPLAAAHSRMRLSSWSRRAGRGLDPASAARPCGYEDVDADGDRGGHPSPSLQNPPHHLEGVLGAEPGGG